MTIDLKNYIPSVEEMKVTIIKNYFKIMMAKINW